MDGNVLMQSVIYQCMGAESSQHAAFAMDETVCDRARRKVSVDPILDSGASRHILSDESDSEKDSQRKIM